MMTAFSAVLCKIAGVHPDENYTGIPLSDKEAVLEWLYKSKFFLGRPVMKAIKIGVEQINQPKEK